MTAPVPTNGFPAGVVNPGLPPVEQKPGFVPQVPPVVVPSAPSPAAASTPAPAGADLAASIAALTAAFAATTPAQTPAPPVAAPTEAAPVSALESDSDPILRSMATVMRTVGKGLDLDRVLGNALQHGDINLIDKAYLTEKAGESAPELLTIAQGIVQAVTAKAEATNAAVYAMAGGEPNWNASVASFNKDAAPELKTVIVQMLDSTNQAQVQAAAKLIVEFAKSRGAVVTPAGLIANNGSAPVVGQALSKAEFQTELQKLNPQDREYMTKRDDLFGRRQAGKQLGK